MIPVVELIRIEENFQHGTFGVLRIQKQAFCVTLEPADLENRRNVSSIPAQQYECRKIVSPRFDVTYQIMNVPDRDNVLFHAGNRIKDTEGCVILAEHYGKLQSDRAVLNSGETFRKFLSIVGELAKPHYRFHLTIYEHF